MLATVTRYTAATARRFAAPTICTPATAHTAWNAMPGSSATIPVNPSAAVATDSTIDTIQTSANARSVQPPITSTFDIVLVLSTPQRA